MRDELKRRLFGAAGALGTSLAIGAERSGTFGTAHLSLQLLAVLITLSWAPLLVHTAALSALPEPLVALLFLAWFAACGYSVLIALLHELFLGHRVAGAQWYDALWRVYAILALWIGLAVANERYVRPWWRANSERYLGRWRSSNSVAAQAHQMALDKRVQTLEAIKVRVRRALKKKALAEKRVKEVEEAVREAEAEAERVQGAGEGAEAAEAREKAKEKTEDELLRVEVALDDVKSHLDVLQSEWTEALHIENHTVFYR